jgi:hypothetical protein
MARDKSDERQGEEEAARRRDEALRGALQTRPGPKKGKGEKKAPTPRQRRRARKGEKA